ncbi:MAG: hypothetical protein JJT75_03710 [Opitutales bacterium]|nr:hypothetical protein [Opitutales bacterium]MCH8541060.1 hypothetical protein [Opitutales bacterium]
MKAIFWRKGLVFWGTIGWLGASLNGEVPEKYADIVAAYTGPKHFSLWPETFVEEYNAYLEEIGETRYQRFLEYAEEILASMEEHHWSEAYHSAHEEENRMADWFNEDRWEEAVTFREQVLDLESLPLGFSITEKSEEFYDVSEYMVHVREIRDLARYFSEAAKLALVREKPEEAMRFVQAAHFIGGHLFRPVNFLDSLTFMAVSGMSITAFWEMGWESWPTEEGKEWLESLQTGRPPMNQLGDALSLEPIFLLSNLPNLVETSREDFIESAGGVGFLGIGWSPEIEDPESFYEMYFEEEGWREDVKRTLSLYSSVADLLFLPPEKRREVLRDLEEASTKEDSPKFIISNDVFQMLDRLVTSHLTTKSVSRLAALASAIRVYEAQNGSLPGELADLPLWQDDAAWGTNPFTGEPVRYELTEDGFSLAMEVPELSERNQETLRRRIVVPSE